MAAENLKTMTRGQLVKLAKSLGLRPLKLWSDVKLRNEIRHVRKAAKPTSKAAWPTEWPKEMRREYYQEIVGSPMPDEGKGAYARLLRVIDQKVPEISPALTKEGPDCFGIYYEPRFQYCNEACPAMPLCKAACERRPELVAMAEAMAQAMAEGDKVTDAEAKEALDDAKTGTGNKKVAKKTTPKKKAAKPKLATRKKKVDPKEQVYVWVGRVRDYELSDVGEEMMEVIRWMAGRKRRGFTFEELSKQLDDYFEEDGDVIAKENLDLMLEEGDVKKRRLS